MIKTKSLLLCVIVSLLCYSCFYDRLSFYHRDYKPKFNSNLRFDGYYTAEKRDQKGVQVKYADAFAYDPKHFYQDGFVAGHVNGAGKKGAIIEKCTKDNIVRNADVNFVWGVYITLGDTLIIEALQPRIYGYFATMERITNMFTIKKDTLILFNYMYQNSKPKKLTDTLYFHPCAYKPDSSKNWIRKEAKYNR